MKKHLPIDIWALACIILLASPVALAAGTFRFLNTGLPEGSTSQPYYAVLLTANAVGAVTYTLDGTSDPWPAGITMNANTGEIVGQALSSANQNMVINATDSNGRTPLMYAARYNQPTAVRLLLEHGAIIKARDKSGMTALELAKSSGNQEIIKLLQSAGVPGAAK